MDTVDEHAGHAAKAHLVPAFILLAVICALTSWGIGLMNSGGFVTGLPAAIIVFLLGGFFLLSFGRGDA